MPQLLYPQGKSLWYPLNRRLGGPQSLSGYGGESPLFDSNIITDTRGLQKVKELILACGATHVTSHTLLLAVTFQNSMETF